MTPKPSVKPDSLNDIIPNHESVRWKMTPAPLSATNIASTRSAVGRMWLYSVGCMSGTVCSVWCVVGALEFRGGLRLQGLRRRGTWGERLPTTWDHAGCDVAHVEQHQSHSWCRSRVARARALSTDEIGVPWGNILPNRKLIQGARDE